MRTVADRIDDFRARDATPVSVLPEPVEGAEDWQERYDLPYPLLADSDAAVSDAYDQPVRFGSACSVGSATSSAGCPRW
ncbi:redoxin domain-containing protein [Haloplanus salinus]|uniref:redoxin domain-containing protein n=1 Tax=Haloplanus salinus TaxID=1126245 RepID=UPI001FEBBCD7|nr:redoxin domain-containing protein [Haloplanus salinus]